MPVAQAAGMLTRYNDYRERVFDRQGQLQYQLTTREYLQRMPSGRPSLSVSLRCAKYNEHHWSSSKAP
jgi:hypothetical protein